ncbi:MAG: TonB-dependent receptor [Cyclobacteriaceae bacterium]
MHKTAKPICVFLITLISIGDLIAQNNCQHQVEGWVFEINSNEPVPYATVSIQGTTLGSIADDNGYFIIKNICDEEFNLQLSHVGYKPIIHHHDVYHESPTIYMAPDEQILESIVVEGEAQASDIFSGSISRISSEDFHDVESENLGEALGTISGINMLSTGQNIVKPIIHGVHSNRVLIINNGVRHEFQNWGAEHAPEIDPSLVDNLEVIKGAATVRYGPDALGGVVLINPPPIDLESHLHGEIRITGKSNGRSGETTARLSKGYKRFGLMAEGSWLRQGDLHSPDYQLTNTGKKEISYAGGMRYHLTNWDFEAYYSHFDQELGILRGAVNGNLDDVQNAIENEPPPDTEPFSYDINNPKQKVVHDLFKLKGVYQGTNQSLSFQYGYQVNDRQEFDVRRGTNNELPNIDLQLKTHSLDIDWNHQPWGKLSGIIGIQNQFQDNNNIPGTNTPLFIPNYAQYRIGIFAIETIETSSVLYETGLRYDYQHSSISGREQNNDIFRNQLDFQNFTATVGLRKKLSESLTFRSNLGSAWRPPNVSELYAFGRHQASIEYGLWRYTQDEDGNVTTSEILTEIDRPVKSEAGYKWINTLNISRNKASYEITGYFNYIRNFIFTRPAGITNTVRGAFPFFLYDQTDAIFWGFDYSSKHELARQVELELQASYLWSKQTTGDFFVGQPPADIRLATNYQPNIGWFDQTTIGLGFQYTFKQFQAPRIISIAELNEAYTNDGNIFDDDNSDFDILAEPDGYILTNLSWNSTVGKFEWTLSIKNLLDISYRNYTNRLRYFADEMGRNVSVSISYRL